MAVEVSGRFDWIENLDAPGGVIDAALEHLQYEHFLADRTAVRNAIPLENARSLAAATDRTHVLGLAVFEAPVTVDHLIEILDALPEASQLMVFLRHYVDTGHPSIVSRLVAAETDDEFKLKVTGHIHRLVSNQPSGSKYNPKNDEFPTETEKFASIADYAPTVGKRTVVEVNEGGVRFEFISELKANSKKLVVFGQDALNRQVVGLPHFYRWSWAREIDASALFLNDPSIYADERLLAGWWVGTRERDYIEEMVSIIRKIMAEQGILAENVTFFGASAGGYSSFQMAAVLHGSRAIVDIPQVDLTKYFARSASDATIAAGLGYKTAEDVEPEFRHRIDVVERFRREKYVPDFLYLQNNRDSQHVAKQMGAFLYKISELMEEHDWAHAQFSVETYSAWHLKKGGHFPLSRADSIARINAYINSPRQRIRAVPSPAARTKS
ncbi:hypothetical protein ACQR35_05100 [Pseudarthrobacter sp. J1738]|uniref:hypothetical protein n=1 Tax=Pseudarthrobacter sp. J1738 TaxID=3420446 RepID=UPI003D2D2FB3